MDENKINDASMNQRISETNETAIENESQQQNAPLLYKCLKCGTEIFENCNFCPKCGTQKVSINVSVSCKKCGAILVPDQEFCMNCGTKNKSIKGKKKKSKKLKVLIAIVAVVIIGVIVSIASGSSKDLNKVYASVVDGSSIYVDITADGKSISVDTNPFDYDDYYSSEATDYVKAINDALGLPNSVYDKMQSTSALDGRISEEHGNIRVSWKYHPDNGLQVIYEVIE